MYDPWSACNGRITMTTNMWNSREQNIKLLILRILFNIHLWNQYNAQDKSVFENVAFRCSYMFRHVCAITREIIHQI